MGEYPSCARQTTVTRRTAMYEATGEAATIQYAPKALGVQHRVASGALARGGYWGCRALPESVTVRRAFPRHALDG